MKRSLMRKIKYISCCVLSAVMVSTALFSSGCNLFKTSDDIYDDIVETVEEFFDHSDTLTMKVSITTQRNEKEIDKTSITFSTNPEEGLMFLSMTSKNSEVKGKVFQQDGQAYLMSYTKIFDEVDNLTTSVEVTDYYTLSKDAVSYFTSFPALGALSSIDLSSLFEEYLFSYTETKNAHEKVYAEQLATRKKTDEHAGAEYRLTTSKNLNSTSFEEYSEIKKYDTGYHGWGVYTVTERAQITEKNKKLSQMVAESTVSFAKATTNETSDSAKLTMQLDLDYSFDSKGHKALEVDLSKDKDITSYPYQETYTMKFDIDGWVTEKTTTATSFAPDIIFQNLTQPFTVTGCNVVWYEDAAHTKPFHPTNYTYSQFHNIDCVYGKLTAMDGYAVIIHDFYMNDNRPNEYKAVFGPIEDDTNKDSLTAIQIVNETTTYLPVFGDSYTSTVNGKPYDWDTRFFDLESAKIYHVEHAKTPADKTESIFAIDNATSLWLLTE